MLATTRAPRRSGLARAGHVALRRASGGPTVRAGCVTVPSAAPPRGRNLTSRRGKDMSYRIKGSFLAAAVGCFGLALVAMQRQAAASAPTQSLLHLPRAPL